MARRDRARSTAAGGPHHVEVDAVAQRPWLARLPDPGRRVAPQRIRRTGRPPRLRSRTRSARTAGTRDGFRIRTRCSGLAARQGSLPEPRSRAAAETASACSSESRRTRMPVGRRSRRISADSSRTRPASAAPSISEGASNQAVVTASSTRQSVPIWVMRGTVGPIPDDRLRICSAGPSSDGPGESPGPGQLPVRVERAILSGPVATPRRPTSGPT